MPELLSCRQWLYLQSLLIQLLVSWYQLSHRNLFKESKLWRERKNQALREEASWRAAFRNSLNSVDHNIRNWVSTEEHGGSWRLLCDPPCYTCAHSLFCDVFLQSCRALVSLATCYSDTCYNHFCPLCYIGVLIWLMLNLGLYNTERSVIIEPTDMKMSGWHGKLSGAFSQVSKQNGLKLQIAGVSYRNFQLHDF